MRWNIINIFSSDRMKRIITLAFLWLAYGCFNGFEIIFATNYKSKNTANRNWFNPTGPIKHSTDSCIVSFLQYWCWTKVADTWYNTFSWRQGTPQQKCSGMTLVVKRSHNFTSNGMNHTCFCLSIRSWFSFTDPKGMEGWVSLDTWVPSLPLKRVPPPPLKREASFLLPKEVPPVREVTEGRSPSLIPQLPASSNSHPVNLCLTGPAIHHGECIRSPAK